MDKGNDSENQRDGQTKVFLEEAERNNDKK